MLDATSRFGHWTAKLGVVDTPSEEACNGHKCYDCDGRYDT
jgi:hypothetical protein